jgi:hypothetical protein
MIKEPPKFLMWAEQDDKESRLMLQIGDDKEICLLRYDREFRDHVGNDFTVFQSQLLPESDKSVPVPSWVGLLCQLTLQPPKLDA